MSLSITPNHNAYSKKASFKADTATVEPSTRKHPADHEVLWDTRDLPEPHNKPFMQIRGKLMTGKDGKTWWYDYLHKETGNGKPGTLRAYPQLKKGEISNDRVEEMPCGVHSVTILKNGKGRDFIPLVLMNRPTFDGLFDVSIELPGGAIEDGQTIQTAAKVENLQEIRYKAGKKTKVSILTPLTAPLPGQDSDLQSLVKVEGLEKDTDAQIGEDDDEKQIMLGKTLLVPVDKAYERLQKLNYNGININGERKSCVIQGNIYQGLGFLMKEKCDKLEIENDKLQAENNKLKAQLDEIIKASPRIGLD